MAVLAVAGPDGETRPYRLGTARFTIGRSPGNDLAIDSPFVSREHAVVTAEAGSYLIQDLSSKNGTWVNGARLGAQPQRLTDGDRISIGHDQLALRFFAGETTLTWAADAQPTDLRVDIAGREVYRGGERLSPPLTRKEFDLLSLLWERRGTACARDEMAARGWPERPEGDVSDTEIDQYMRRVRRRLGDGEGKPRLIVTVRRYGYKLA